MKYLSLLLLPLTLLGVSLEPPSSFYLDTIDFDIDDSLSFTRPNWNDTDDIFYYNLVSFTVDTAGEWRASNSSITSHDSFDYSRYPNHQTPWFNADTYLYVYEGSFTPTLSSGTSTTPTSSGYGGYVKVGKIFGMLLYVLFLYKKIQKLHTNLSKIQKNKI